VPVSNDSLFLLRGLLEMMSVLFFLTCLFFLIAGLTAAGFTSSGIVSESIASAVQSGIGKMSARSVFAKVQSLGVIGVVTEVGVTGAIGLLVLAPYV
jgi:hypothetical protein